MDDKSIKNFDRHIEQQMNEHAVTPPFGAWNRISAELDAEPVVGNGSAPNPFLPKGAVIGFVSGALVIGSIITGWLAYQGHHTTTGAITSPTTSQAIEQNKLQSEPLVISEATPAYVIKKAITPPATIEPDKISTNDQDNSQIQTINDLNEFSTSRFNDVSVPTEKSLNNHLSATQQPYYFPPVDIDVPTDGANNLHSSSANQAQNNTEGSSLENGNTNTNDITPPNEKRIKFRKKRRADWSYPRITRARSKRSPWHY